MFPKNMRCPTCDLRKQARSKHWVCNLCVHWFYHHCAWVKNCIGTWNTRYFLSYLLTLTVSAATMAVVSTVFLVQPAVMSDWYLETYVDDLGHLQAVDPVVLTQYLFLTFPRILLPVGFVVVLSFPLGATCASVCTWPPPTRPLTSSTKATEPGASTAATQPGPISRAAGSPERPLPQALEQALRDCSTCYCTLREKEEIGMGRVLLPFKYSIHLFMHMDIF